MPTIGSNQPLTMLVKKVTSITIHLILRTSEKGMLFFACEQAPLMTFQSFGSPQRCPICRQENPICGAQEEE
jgi:hypothetical protein